jgi:hypothetical protein
MKENLGVICMKKVGELCPKTGVAMTNVSIEITKIASGKTIRTELAIPD